MRVRGLRCFGCGRVFPFRIGQYECDECGWPLEVLYDRTPPVDKRSEFVAIMERARRMWDFAALLPICREENRVSLGEGGTPLIRLESRAVPFEGLWIKNEGLNPTGSFKDRPLSVIVSVAREWNADLLMTSSSGNAGVALAAYSAAAGIPAVVVVPETVSEEKLVPMRLFGASVIKVRGTTSDAVKLVEKAVGHFGGRCVDATTTFRNPLGIEGDKTIAYELIRDLGYICPDYVIVPIGAGPLLVGIYKGFQDAYMAGVIDSIPRLVGVQAEGCAPIAYAFQQGSSTVKAWPYPETIASGIADPLFGYEVDGAVTLRFIKDSGGYCISVADREILSAMRLLASCAGLFAEPTGAVSMAGFLTLLAEGKLKGNEKVVCILTGQGFKEGRKVGELMDWGDVPIVGRDDDKVLLEICDDVIQKNTKGSSCQLCSQGKREEGNE